MIQAPRPPGLQYGIRRIAGFADSRVPRVQQSAAASHLLAHLRRESGLLDGPSSKAHSRAWAAAAVAGEGRVGIDIEYHTPDRPIARIAAWLMKAEAPDDTAAWRVFTFYEAYFKAMGETPSKPLMRDVAGANDARLQIGAVSVLRTAPAPSLTLTLVWTGPFDSPVFSVE